jgi:hypothetical protein
VYRTDILEQHYRGHAPIYVSSLNRCVTDVLSIAVSDSMCSLNSQTVFYSQLNCYLGNIGTKQVLAHNRVSGKVRENLISSS